MKIPFMLSLLLTSSMAMAKTYLVEMKQPLSEKQLKSFSKIFGVTSIKLFDNIKNEYFSKLYEVEVASLSAGNIAKFSQVVQVEEIHPVEVFSIKPNPKSKMLTND